MGNNVSQCGLCHKSFPVHKLFQVCADDRKYIVDFRNGVILERTSKKQWIVVILIASVCAYTLGNSMGSFSADKQLQLISRHATDQKQIIQLRDQEIKGLSDTERGFFLWFFHLFYQIIRFWAHLYYIIHGNDPSKSTSTRML